MKTCPISHREATILAEDEEGSLWVGTSGGGLNQVQPRTIRIEGEEAGLPFQAVQTIREASDGVFWAVTQDGRVVRRDNGSWLDGFPSDVRFEGEASCMTIDKDGAIWIGTKDRRLYRWNGHTLTSWGDRRGFAHRSHPRADV